MFFVLSKTLNYLAMPLTLVCLCFLISVFLKNEKWRKRLFWTALGLLLFFSNEFFANECMLAWEVQAKPLNSLPHYKLAIVLTGSTIVHDPKDRVYFQRGADRVTHTVQLYKEGYVEKILISGGTGRLAGEEEPEADKFRKAMVMMGVMDSDILIENETRNTAESAIQVKKMMQELNYQDKDCLLITSAFHMRRSLACYNKQGMDPDTFSTDFYSHPTDFYLDTLIVPKVEAVMIWQKLLKEWVGLFAYKIAGYA
jgi:uncharacterized SAM-binding protein YcdF (DUF218 family)